jgi:Flp pilus assembly protein TadD
MSEDNKQLALAEKDLGNQAYKKRDFENALVHYNKAYELDNTNITFLTNKAGKLTWVINHTKSEKLNVFY